MRRGKILMKKIRKANPPFNLEGLLQFVLKISET